MKTIPIVPQIEPSSHPMELIIKPTEACNFKCTFCSSTQIADNHTHVLDLEQIFTFLRRFPNTSTIIVNGGDPLMVHPVYYQKIIDFLDEYDMPASISLTTNLWAFYKKPNKWYSIFTHPRVCITTSFHYGDTRLKGDYSVFSEEDFWNVSDTMLKYIGYRPDFISVITNDNEEAALENVRLAKRMDVECKLNYAMASGDQFEPYLLSKIYAAYIQVYWQGLMQWEYNTKQMVKRLVGGATSCPQNRDCDSTIRAINPEGDYYSCGAFGDDRDRAIDFNKEIYEGIIQRPLLNDPAIQTMTEHCYSCPMFKICNGCKKTIKDLKRHGLAEKHCVHMKQLAPYIQQINEETFYGIDKPNIPV